VRGRRNRSVHIRLFEAGTLVAALVLISVWLANPGQAQGQSAESDHALSIRGTVVNSITHEPIARAQVYSQDNRFAVMTDDQGHFEATPPQTGQAGDITFGGAPLVARKPGFLTDRNDQGQRIWANSSAPELTISLVPEAILMGRIALASSDSPDGIQVQLFRREIRDGLGHWIPQQIFITNSKGEYRFAELYAGDYRVGTHEVGDRDPEDFVPGGKVYGYPPVYFPEASDFPGANTIHLSPGKIFQADLSLARKQYYPIKISVVNGPPGGTPINVDVSVQGDGAPGYSLGYNAFDQTIRGMLPNGFYVVQASSFSQIGATALMNLRVANGPVQGGSLMLLPNGTIAVQVKEEFTMTTVPPEQNQQVIMGGRGGRMNAQSRQRYLNVMLEPGSDFGQGRGGYLRPPAGPNDESLAIDNVQPGRYWVQVTSSRGYAASVSAGGLDLQHEAFIAGPGGSSSPIEITMRDDTASFDGTIEGANSASTRANSSTGTAAYVYCIPQPDSSGQFNQVWVSPDGKFNSPEMPPGVYQILAFKHQQNDLEYRNPEAMRAYESKGQIVRLAAGQKEHLQLQLISKAGEDAD
jgi:hypothetical protein